MNRSLRGSEVEGRAAYLLVPTPPNTGVLERKAIEASMLRRTTTSAMEPFTGDLRRLTARGIEQRKT
ncbi:MAG: hypothetical protein KJO19_13130 [Woeseia sp.]|nr:hypothetical protein [Woeseia sp.]